jgi:hypothetical protein
MWVKTLAVPAAVLLLFVLSCCSTTPESKGVLDPDSLLSADQRTRIIQQHKVLLDELDIDFFLVITPTAVADIDREAAQWFSRHNVGTSSRKQQGVLFLVDPLQQHLKIEISYSLEATFPDSFIGYIERQQMLPFFNSGRIGQGIEAAVELLVNRAVAAAAGTAFAPLQKLDPAFLSGGAGAETGYGEETPLLSPADNNKQISAQPTPQEALAAYKTVLATHNKRADLGLYTPQTRSFFSKWTVTDAQFDNVLHKLRTSSPEKIITMDNLAVIRYPVDERQLSPFLLVRGAWGWMFDFAAMHRVIGINHKNQWHFLSIDHPYMFAFTDWQFDTNGFPFK